VYGYLLGINRKKPHTLEVVVDSWPHFKTIICRTDLKNKKSADYMKKVTLFSTDGQSLKRMLMDDSAIDWSTYFLIGGLDDRHATLLKEVCVTRQVPVQLFTQVRLMTLPDPSRLPGLDINRTMLFSLLGDTASRISSLNESHIDLVNKTWKCGGSAQGFRNIQKLITNFPSCCITDDQGNPISWVLVYDYCALGLLYTLPEHRGKGYAKILISTISKSLRAQGYSVYSFIEEENKVSYRLFKGLGFTEEPAYRAVWFEFNY
ncbi:GLYL3 protein, partial [Amia calva]|nr:GLYL3 protein [Amia calva]